MSFLTSFLPLASCLMLLASCFLPLCPVIAQDSLKTQNQTVPTVSRFSYTIQKYMGFNFIVDRVVESIIKILVKHKVHSRNVDIDLRVYSGWDLIQKKAEYLKLQASKLSLEGIPIDYFSLETNSPIYFKKIKTNEKQRNIAQVPLDITANIEIHTSDINKALNEMPKWKKIFKDLDLPVPPFGTTKVELSNLDIMLDEHGLLRMSSELKSLENPQSEPLNLAFQGFLKIQNEKIIIDNLECEVQDIFTKDSEIGKSFSVFLEDLINPIFNFHKYEKKGLTIKHIEMFFELNKLILIAKLKIL